MPRNCHVPDHSKHNTSTRLKCLLQVHPFLFSVVTSVHTCPEEWGTRVAIAMTSSWASGPLKSRKRRYVEYKADDDVPVQTTTTQ